MDAAPFARIDASRLTLDVGRIKGKSVYRNKTFEEFSIADIAYLTDVVSQKLKFEIAPSVINLTEISRPGATPHIDRFNVALNYYVAASGLDETTFWETQADIKYRYGVSNGFNEAGLTPLSIRLFAKQDDFVLLNTRIIHSVKVSENRLILRFCWIGYSFKQVFDSISVI